MGRHRLEDLASVLDTIALIPADVAAEVAPKINEQILKMGKPKGPLRAGNAVKAHVEAAGDSIRIVGVFPSAGVRRSWVAAIEKIVAEELRKRLVG